jgi:hypothetical protein
MRLLFRIAFWLAVVVLLLPSAPSQPGAPTQPNGSQRLARPALAEDMRRSCPRRLDACCDDLRAFAKLCRDVHHFLSEWGAQRDTMSASDRANPGQQTLTSTDLHAPWRGPPPRKETGVTPAAIR